MAGPLSISQLTGIPSIFAGTEVFPVTQSGVTYKCTFNQQVTNLNASASIVGTEVFLNVAGTSPQKTTLAQLITQCTASASIAGTELLLQSPSAGSILKTTIAQTITQATAAGNPQAADNFTGIQSANYRKYALSQIADFEDVYIAGGGVSTQTVAPSPAYTAYFAGMSFWFIASATNTGALTMNVSGLGAKAINYTGNFALQGGEVVINAAYKVTYDGTRFILLNPSTVSKTFTATGVGFSAGTLTATVNYSINGSLVELTFQSVITGTSNAPTFTITGLPAFIVPISTKTWNVAIEDAGAWSMGFIQLSGNTFTLGKLPNAPGGFTGSGTKAFGSGQTTFVYSVAS